MERYEDGKMHGWIYEQTKGNLDDCMNSWLNRNIHVHVLDKRMDEQMGG